jgi:GTP-binding protein
MQVTEAVFIKSSSRQAECPKPVFPEYAFIGRSNVGKSTLINMICDKNGLAKTSSTPGKTIAINHYKINDRWYLVDLPGYGYARRSKELRAQWENRLDEYLSKRENLQCVFVLIDSRIPPQQSDLEFANHLGNLQVPFVFVFTKCDKLKANELTDQVNLFCEAVLENWEEMPRCFITSGQNGTGRQEILKFMEECNKLFRRF